MDRVRVERLGFTLIHQPVSDNPELPRNHTVKYAIDMNGVLCSWLSGLVKHYFCSRTPRASPSNLGVRIFHFASGVAIERVEIKQTQHPVENLSEPALSPP